MRLGESSHIQIKNTNYELAYNLETADLYYRKNDSTGWARYDKLPNCHRQAIIAAGFEMVSQQVMEQRLAVIEAYRKERALAGRVTHDPRSLPDMSNGGRNGSVRPNKRRSGLSFFS